MPDIVTHATFALDVVNNINDINIKNILLKHKYIYFLGSQGPDIFYFQNDKNFFGFGNYMHDYHTDDFLIASIIYLKKHYSEELLAYVYGLICHHALDRNAHPYVYYVTGKYNKDNLNTFKYRGNHMRLERAIDSMFIKERWNEKHPHKFKIHKHILNYKINSAIFLPFYNGLLNKVYNKDNGGKVFMASVKNFRNYTKILHDPFGFKKKIARMIDKLFNKKSKLVFETMFHYQNINPNIDYMNLYKKEWCNPIDQTCKSSKSFMDLYCDGINEAVDTINQVTQYLNTKAKNSSLNTIICDLSYSTGKSWKIKDKMKHFNVILKEEQ